MTRRFVPLILAAVGAIVTALLIAVGQWAIAFVTGLLAAGVAYDAIMRVIRGNEGPRERMSPLDRLLAEAEHPHPPGSIGGSILVMVMLLLFALQEGYDRMAWILGPILAFQTLVLAAVLIRRRRH